MYRREVDGRKTPFWWKTHKQKRERKKGKEKDREK